MNLSPRFKIFFAVSVLLFMFNLLLTNDYTVFWNGAENDILTAAVGGELTSAILPGIKANAIYRIFGLAEFWQRLPAVGVTLLGVFGLYYFGRKIFGLRTILLAVLVLISTLLLPNVAKRATADAWLFFSLLLADLNLILHLKRGDKRSLGWFTLFVAVGLLSAAPATLGFLLGSGGVYALGKFGTRTRGLRLTFAGLFITGLLLWYFTGGRMPVTEVGLSYLSLGQFLGISLLGILPWIAFLPAAILDLIKKLRRGEEMSLLLTGMLIGGLFSFSVVWQAALALLIAKQIEKYFDPNYPYVNWVKTVAVLHIIAAFIGGIALMLNGFYILETEGFRLAMSVGAVHWIPAFLGVIGVFGKNAATLIGGMTASGLLVTFFFWTVIGPVMNNFRQTPKIISEKAATDKENDTLYFLTPEQPPANYFLYARKNFNDVRTLTLPDFASVRPTTEDVIVWRDSIPAAIRLADDAQIDTILQRKIIGEGQRWLIVR